MTPFLSMARSLGDRGGQSIDFYYCVEHVEEAHFLDELEAIASATRRLSRHGRRRATATGFLTADRLADEHADLDSAHVLICGPPAMIDSLRAQLVGARRHRSGGSMRRSSASPSSAVRARARRRRGDDAVALTALVGALSATALLVVVALAVAAYAT